MSPPELDLGMGSPGDPVTLWASLERKYSRASWSAQPSRVIAQRHGGTPVLLTAPHAGHQMRNNWPKPADSGTGGLAEVLAQMVGCAVVTVSGVQTDDPNWDVAVGAFKSEALRRLPAHPFAIDLHGMRPERSVDICIGTGPAPDYATLRYARWCAAQARAAGFLVSINHPFPAARDGTMTAFTQRSGYRGIQIEVNARFLDPEGSPRAAQRVVDMLSRIIPAAPS